MNTFKTNAMGKNKKNLGDLKNERLKEIKKNDMNKLIGGKSGKHRWKSLCGGIIPQ